MRINVVVSTLCVALLCSSGAAVQADVSPVPSPSVSAVPSSAPVAPIELARSRVDTMLRTGHADPGWFSDAFLAQVSAAKIDEIIVTLKGSLGDYRSVRATPAAFVAEFAKGTDDVLIHLDAESKIDALLFRQPHLTAASLEAALTALQRPSATLSYVLVAEGRSERAASNASASLAVGSAFKLAVLEAIQDEVARGRLRWTDVVPLKREWKSLPSGILRTWPDGTPLTVATYAAEMISISDNSAADALVRIAGASALRPYAGSNEPFLTTREMFTLKSTGAEALRSAYLNAASVGARSAVLRRADALPLPALTSLATAPDAAVEWHYSVRQLCEAMRRVADLPLMTINPGVADASRFRRVAYKGGSDAGILNLTTMVTTTRGSHVCFSATLNDSAHAVDKSSFEAAYGGVLDFIARM